MTTARIKQEGIQTVVPAALQVVDGREGLSDYTKTFHKRTLSSSFESDTAESPSPSGKTRKPMRKRAKTQEEKEERAQERIMRNRAAAQVSRERKREHMVSLEQENEQLQEQMRALTTDNLSLRETVSTLTSRLEQMEKMMAFLTAPGTTSISDSSAATTTTAISTDSSNEQTFYCPTPPGTIRPQDLQSNPSTPAMRPIDSRNPAVIVNGPQRRISMRFPWTLSSRSPIYRQMEAILTFWTTILREQTLRAFSSQTVTLLLMQCALFQRQSSPRALDHWRFAATGLGAQAMRSIVGKGVLSIKGESAWQEEMHYERENLD